MRILRADAVDQNFVKLADLARTRHRKRQHVPERKAEIIDQYLPARLRMPLGRIERCQQIIEVTRACIQVDLGGQLRDQPVDLVALALHESSRIYLKMLDLRGRWRGRKNVGSQIAHLAAIELGAFPTPQVIKADIELALEPIDKERIEPSEA